MPSLILGTSTSSTTESRLFVEGMRCFVGGGPRHIESSIFGNRVHGAFFEWLGLVLTAAWDVGPNPVLDVTFADDRASGAGSEGEAWRCSLVRRTKQLAKAGVSLIITGASLVLVEFALMLVSTSGLAFGHVHVAAIVGSVHLLLEVTTRSVL